MKKALLASAFSFGVFCMPTIGSAGEFAPDAIRKCSDQPLTMACLAYYAQRNQDNVAKVVDDLAAGRVPTLRTPELPGLDGLFAIDPGKLLSPK